MSVVDTTRAIVEPILDEQNLILFDLEHHAGVLRVTVDRPGATAEGDGVDVDQLAAATRAISRALDEQDPIAGRYTLEVSSPGLERTLRTPAHFAWARGQRVSVKTVPTVDGARRLTGALVDSDDEGFVLTPDEQPDDRIRLRYVDVERARTIFEWGASEKPRGKHSRPTTGAGTKQKPKQPQREERDAAHDDEAKAS